MIDLTLFYLPVSGLFRKGGTVTNSICGHFSLASSLFICLVTPKSLAS